jgi:hypothetical protein
MDPTISQVEMPSTNINDLSPPSIHQITTLATHTEIVYYIYTPSHLEWLFITHLPKLETDKQNKTINEIKYKYRYIIKNNIDMRQKPLNIINEITLEDSSIEGEGSNGGQISISNLNLTTTVKNMRPYLIDTIDPNSIIKNIRFYNYNYTLFNNNFGTIDRCFFADSTININMTTMDEYTNIYEKGESLSAVVSINYNLIQNCFFKDIKMIINTNKFMLDVFKMFPLLNNFKFGCITVINKATIYNCSLKNISITSTYQDTFGFCSAVACINEGGIVGLKIDNININGDTSSCISYLNSGTIKELDIGKQITLKHNKFSSIISVYNYNNLNTVISCIKLFKTTYDQYGLTQDDRKQYENIYILNEDGLINNIINEDKMNPCSIGTFGSLKRQATTPSPPTMPATTPVPPTMPATIPAPPTMPVTIPSPPTMPVTIPAPPTIPVPSPEPIPETPKSNKINYGLSVGLPIGIVVSLLIIILIIFAIAYKNIVSVMYMVFKFF